jgi:hypothetical protein
MNDDLMFEYLMQMGALQPDEEELRRKQAMVDALRKNASQSPEGQMVSGHYVAPSITQYGAQLMNAYGARKGQEGVDQGLRGLNDKQRKMLEDLKRRRGMRSGGGMGMPSSDPYGNLPTYGSVT